MKPKRIMIALLLTCAFIPLHVYSTFISAREKLKEYESNSAVVLIASTGRSASTMLTSQITRYAKQHEVHKTHLLPPDKKFKGKILFIFSNPDLAAESALYLTYNKKMFAPMHFRNVETADRDWYKKIGNIENQTEEQNLLSYDAFGIHEHLKAWLYTQTQPAKPLEAQILAIKYEHLWDRATILAIQNFLDLEEFQLPAKIQRGSNNTVEYPQVKTFRKLYNLGTEKDPRYLAYHEARMLWEAAPPFQYLKIIGDCDLH